MILPFEQETHGVIIGVLLADIHDSLLKVNVIIIVLRAYKDSNYVSVTSEIAASAIHHVLVVYMEKFFDDTSQEVTFVDEGIHYF